jgi:hypothetical protein
MRTIADDAAVDRLVVAIERGDTRAAAYAASELAASGKPRLVSDACFRTAHLAHPAYATTVLAMLTDFRCRTCDLPADAIATLVTAVRSRASDAASGPACLMSVKEALDLLPPGPGRDLLCRLPANAPKRWDGVSRLCVTAAVRGVKQAGAVVNQPLRDLLDGHRTGKVQMGGGDAEGLAGGLRGARSELKLCAIWTHAAARPRAARARDVGPSSAAPVKIVSYASRVGVLPDDCGRGVVRIRLNE